MQAYEARPLPLPYALSESGLRVELEFCHRQEKNHTALLEQKTSGHPFLSQKVKNSGSAFSCFCIADVSSSFKLKIFSAHIS